jgi:flagellar biosynthesis/type III secretory pathway protein FliH
MRSQGKAKHERQNLGVSEEMERTSTECEIYQYPSAPESSRPLWDGLDGMLGEIGRDGAAAWSDTSSDAGKALCKDALGVASEDEMPGFDAGRQQGIAEGRQLERCEQLGALAANEKRRVEQATGLIEQVARERDRYLQTVEREVVELALAIAARILRREAQMDPLFLTGAVRVAFGQLANATEVRLRVPASEFELWKESMAHLPNLNLKPTVVPVDEMRLGDCVVEAEVGSVDLGMRTQLGEIERGFFHREERSTAKETPDGHTGVRP